MSFNQKGAISTLNGGRSSEINRQVHVLWQQRLIYWKWCQYSPTEGMKCYQYRLSITWKSDLFDKIKRDFFQVVFLSVLHYGCTTWILAKSIEKRLDGNCTRMLRVILNKSWKQYPTKQPQYALLFPISKTIQVRRTRHVGHCWWTKDELIVTFSNGPLHIDVLVLVDLQEHNFNCSAQTLDPVWKTYR